MNLLFSFVRLILLFCYPFHMITNKQLHGQNHSVIR